MAKTFAAMIELRQTGPKTFETLRPPEKMGNTANIAFGGCTIAVAANVVHDKIPSQFRLYSLTGNFLGPALTDRNFVCTLHEVRNTRTFITRRVDLGQLQDDGKLRPCLIATGDFHLIEPASVLFFSKPPSMTYSPLEKCLVWAERRQQMADQKLISQQAADLNNTLFGLAPRFFDLRTVPEGIAYQNNYGHAKQIKTTQDHLPITSKTSADRMRSRDMLQTPAIQCSAVAFIMDMALSFIALTHSGRFLDDVAACSTLDFALRFLTNDVDMNGWMLREFKTVAGGDGRTYSENLMWDESGKMVASMTQQCIMRPRANTPAAKL